MSSERVIWWNGQMVLGDAVHIRMEDRGYQFGDGVYEVIRVYNGQLFMLDEHINRLIRSAQLIKFQVNLTVDDFKNACIQLCNRNKVHNGIIYLQWTRGVYKRMHTFPPQQDTEHQILAYTQTVQDPTAMQQEGVHAILADDIRWLRCNIKSLNLLGNVLAKQEANEQAAFEAILHRDGMVTEGSSTNVFMVENNTVYTHPATELILHGITRDLVIQICEQIGIEILQKSFTTDQLLKADEIFITSTTIEIVPIIQLNGQQIGEGRLGAITERVLQEVKRRLPRLESF